MNPLQLASRVLALNVLLAFGVAQAAAPTGQAPRFKIHVAPPDLANDAGEPTVGYNPLSKRAMFISYTQANRVTFKENLPVPADALNDALPESCDATWEDKSGLITTLNTLDPLMYTDKTTGRTFNSQLSGANSLFEYSDDDGETWTPGQIGPANGGADHQGMVTGPYPADFPTAGLLFPNAFYYCSQSVAAAFCARSDDGGQTVGPGFPFKNLDCAVGGLHGHPQVAPDGTLYVPDSSQCIAATGLGGGTSGNVIAHVSTDAGVTFTTRAIPTSVGGAGSDPSIGIASDGTAYMCYENADGRARVAVSKDRGVTWINDTDIGEALGILYSRFPAAIAGDPDRAACAFLGATQEGASAALDYTGVWYPYVATTYDGGLSWHLVNVSPDDPVQGHGGVGPDGINRNLLDFNDLEIDERGRTLFAYADGCTGGCVADPANNGFAAKGTIVRQTGGRTLLAAFDNDADTQYNDVANIKPAAACAVQDLSLRTATKTEVIWTAPDNGGSAITNYQVLRSTVKEGPYLKVGDAGPSTSFIDASASPADPVYFYRVIAENALGAAPLSNIIQLDVSDVVEGSLCIAPGLTLATDASGDFDTSIAAPSGMAYHDLEYLQVAQPDATDGKLVISLKVATLAQPLAPSTDWFVSFKAPNGTLYGVRMSTDMVTPRFYSYDVGASSGDISDGRFVGTEGPIEAETDFTAEGLITFVVKATDVGGTGAVGEVFSDFNSGSVQVLGAAGAGAADVVDAAPNGLARTGSIKLGPCLSNIAPLALLGVDKETGPAPLAVNFTVGGSDSDVGDSVVSYSLDFGDGMKLVDQPITSAAIAHSYAQPGNYAAALTVKDSQGLVSSNIARKFITVTAPGTTPPPGSIPPVIGAPPPAAAASTIEQGRFGGSFGLALLPLLLFARRRR
ncbi:MAG: PKD domain-containing protein [Pseudomonadota bacterium]